MICTFVVKKKVQFWCLTDTQGRVSLDLSKSAWNAGLSPHTSQCCWKDKWNNILNELVYISGLRKTRGFILRVLCDRKHAILIWVQANFCFKAEPESKQILFLTHKNKNSPAPRETKMNFDVSNHTESHLERKGMDH